MCYSDPLTEWADDEPAPETATPVRNLILAALAEAFVTRRLGLHPAALAECGTGCGPGVLCADHAADLEAAQEYQALYMRICRTGSDGAVLELTGGLMP